MAKGERHGNREAKKPKQVKAKLVAAATPFAALAAAKAKTTGGRGPKR
jgi:hypothetical protein